MAVSVIWGANFTANKYALRFFTPFLFSALRFVLASVLLWAVVRMIAPPEQIPRRKLLALFALGVVGNTAYQAFFMYGLLGTSAINASLIIGSMPVAVAVLGTVSGIERPSGRLWFGITVATLGVLLVIARRGVRFSGETLRGDLLVLAACICWAAFTVGLRRVAQDLNSLRATAITTYAGTPGLVLAAVPELRRMSWGAIDTAAWLAFLYSAVFSIVVAYLLWNKAVQGIGSSRTALYNCVVPVIAALVAWKALGERPSAGQLAGAVLVIAGVLVSQVGPAVPEVERA